MALRSQQLDSADHRRRQAHDVDENDGLQAWSSGKKTLENSADDPNVKFVGTGVVPDDGVRVIPSDAQLTPQDERDLASGAARLGPVVIPANRTGNLTPTELKALADGTATLGSPQKAATAEFSKGRDGRLEVPGWRLHEALDSGVASLEDIASGKVRVL